MLTLEDAIKHAEEVAKEKEDEAQDLEYSKLDWRREANQCAECAAGCRQLAEWLKELKQFKESAISLDKVKQARKEIENEIKFWSDPGKYNVVSVVNARNAKAQSYKHCLEIIDMLMKGGTE